MSRMTATTAAHAALEGRESRRLFALLGEPELTANRVSDTYIREVALGSDLGIDGGELVLHRLRLGAGAGQGRAALARGGHRHDGDEVVEEREELLGVEEERELPDPPV